MMNQFMDEVLSEGAAAVLPQNLDDRWLAMIYAASISFLKETYDGQEGKGKDSYEFSDLNSMLMLSSVTEILQHNKGYSPDSGAHTIPEKEIFEYLLCYALSIVYESIRREAQFDFTSPTLENIFDQERLYEIERSSPALTDLLNELVASNDTKI